MAEAPSPLYTARVLFDYAAVDETELSVFKGQAVAVLEENESGWSLAEQQGRSGWVPSDFVERIDAVSSAAAGAGEASDEVAAAMKQLNLALKEEQAQGGEEAGDGAEAAAEAAAALEAAGVSVQACGACDKPVVDRYVMAMEKAYHVECFSCCGCQASLAGQPFVPHEGRFHCEECYYRANNPPCGACDDVIRGQYVTALGQAWHPACFVCTECSQPFDGGQFHKHEDRPYCAAHYNQLFGVACSKCNENISGQIFEALGKKFHVDCFTCQHDGHAIGQDATFHLFEDQVYCSAHFEQLFIQTCSRCQNPIEAQFIKVADDHFHPECWQCAGCEKQLDRATVQSRGKDFYCPGCFAQKAAAATSAAAAASAAASGDVPGYMKPTRASAVKAPNLSKRGPSKAAPLNPKAEAERGDQQYFSYTALKSGVPPGVDPKNKERYLEPDVFFRMFKMEQADFAKLKAWKKERMKKAVGLW